jgi:hypothetical protein
MRVTPSEYKRVDENLIVLKSRCFASRIEHPDEAPLAQKIGRVSRFLWVIGNYLGKAGGASERGPSCGWS